MFYYDGRAICDGSIASITTTHCGLFLRKYPGFQITSIAWPTRAVVMWYVLIHVMHIHSIWRLWITLYVFCYDVRAILDGYSLNYCNTVVCIPWCGSSLGGSLSHTRNPILGYQVALVYTRQDITTRQDCTKNTNNMTNTTTMVVKLLAPPVVWIWWLKGWAALHIFYWGRRHVVLLDSLN